MSYNKALQHLIEEYRRIFGDGPLTLPQIADWLIRERRWEPSQEEAMRLLIRHLGQAMRTQYTRDADGRRVRRKHAVRYKDKDESGKQLVLWYDIDIAPPYFMLESLQQRRNSLADGCWQLKQDQDSFNKYHNPAAPIQILLDFREDMEEREQSGYYLNDDDDLEQD